MAKYIAILLVAIGVVLGFRGLYVWTSCGYDCSALSSPSLTATGAILVALLVVFIGIGALVASLLSRRSERG